MDFTHSCTNTYANNLDVPAFGTETTVIWTTM